jgi:hypothetical protein
VARASWKYYFYKDFEVDQYVDKLIDEPIISNSFNNKRHSTLHKLNFFLPTQIHTGKWIIEKLFTKYHIGFKLGQFTKTRKPYYFRSKKKRSVTKKNYVPSTIKYLTSGSKTKTI